VVPEGIDDPERVSGGNVYDRHLRDGLRERGWDVRMTEVADVAGVATALATIADGGIALVDGLVAGWAPEQLELTSARVVVIAHMLAAGFPDATPEAIEAESRALRHAELVIATSTWTASELIRRGVVDPARVAVARPGSTRGAPTPDAVDDRELLCIGVVAPHKGQDLLVDALARLRTDDWTCTVAGSHAVAPGFAARIASAAERFDGRVRLPGVLDPAAVNVAYGRAGVLVAPSRTESFGMAIADARRRGLPVIAAAVGGIPETLAGGGAILVPGDDPAALAAALERWLTEPRLRARLRAEAAQARPGAPRWADTIDRVDELLVAR
jgi:glycosyltransferase involved in cell wall biosynthesis